MKKMSRNILIKEDALKSIQLPNELWVEMVENSKDIHFYLRSGSLFSMLQIIIQIIPINGQDLDKLEQDFVNDFFVMYRWYTSTTRLLHMFKTIYSDRNVLFPSCDQCDEPACNELIIVQKIINALKWWVQYQPQDFLKNSPNMRTLLDFQRFISDDHPNLKIKILDRTKAISSISSRTYNQNIKTPDDKSKNKNASQNRKFGSISSIVLINQDAQYLAQHLTYLDYNSSRQFKVCEFRYYVNHNDITKCPCLKKSIERFNSVSHWVQCMILNKTSPEERASVIEKFIEVAEKLFDMESFNMLMAVIGSILHSSIARLQKTHLFLSPSSKLKLEHFNIILSSHNNYQNYRSIHNAKIPDELNNVKRRGSFRDELLKKYIIAVDKSLARISNKNQLLHSITTYNIKNLKYSKYQRQNFTVLKKKYSSLPVLTFDLEDIKVRDIISGKHKTDLSSNQDATIKFSIPIWGICLKDLITVHAAYPDYLLPQNRMICLVKWTLLCPLIKEILEIKKYSMPYRIDCDLIAMLQLSLDMHFSEEEIYELSLAREPKIMNESDSIYPTNYNQVFSEWVCDIKPAPDWNNLSKHINAMVDAVFKNYDYDNDNHISQTEFESVLDNFPFIDSFAVLDIDKDGLISKEELRKYFYRANCHAFKTGFKHNFVETTYFKLTFCVHCSGLLWGLIKQGYRCKDCDINAHKNCKDVVVLECRSKQKYNAAMLNSNISDLPQRSSSFAGIDKRSSIETNQINLVINGLGLEHKSIGSSIQNASLPNSLGIESANNSICSPLLTVNATDICKKSHSLSDDHSLLTNCDNKNNNLFFERLNVNTYIDDIIDGDNVLLSIPNTPECYNSENRLVCPTISTSSLRSNSPLSDLVEDSNNLQLLNSPILRPNPYLCKSTQTSIEFRCIDGEEHIMGNEKCVWNKTNKNSENNRLLIYERRHENHSKNQLLKIQEKIKAGMIQYFKPNVYDKNIEKIDAHDNKMDTGVITLSSFETHINKSTQTELIVDFGEKNVWQSNFSSANKSNPKLSNSKNLNKLNHKRCPNLDIKYDYKHYKDDNDLKSLTESKSVKKQFSFTLPSKICIRPHPTPKSSNVTTSSGGSECTQFSFSPSLKGTSKFKGFFTSRSLSRTKE